MTWLNSLKSLSSIITRKVEVVYAEPVFLSRGKWVVCPEGVGIVCDLSTSGCVGIDFTGADGHTTHRSIVPASSVLLAKFAQIPESRRPFSQEYATSLGYN
jgi:hypothetical protein